MKEPSLFEAGCPRIEVAICRKSSSVMSGHSKATWSSLPTADSIPVFYPTALTLEPVTLVAVIASSTGYESKGVKAFLLRWGLRTLFSVVLEYAYVTSSIKSKSGYSPSGKTVSQGKEELNF
ncbi:hypothetical protein RHGRI_011419 [Rhododendron griersonianum]|uniref:Uncharacterized protein n=1 Tax=Rhododendron griersonianum TaxID=479676 RepID=A0AAV6KLS4_9ERIC|nr:hypothetical protein RHGRI_011419 [Rhododendron griersonianum]